MGYRLGPSTLCKIHCICGHHSFDLNNLGIVVWMVYNFSALIVQLLTRKSVLQLSLLTNNDPGMPQAIRVNWGFGCNEAVIVGMRAVLVVRYQRVEQISRYMVQLFFLLSHLRLIPLRFANKIWVFTKLCVAKHWFNGSQQKIWRTIVGFESCTYWSAKSIENRLLVIRLLDWILVWRGVHLVTNWGIFCKWRDSCLRVKVCRIIIN